jgi:Tetratricopeptide repeat
VLGPEHPSTATCLNDLGNVFWEQRDVGTARPLFTRALTIGEIGPDHPATATSLNGLACLHHEGNMSQAQPLFYRA